LNGDVVVVVVVALDGDGVLVGGFGDVVPVVDGEVGLLLVLEEVFLNGEAVGDGVDAGRR